MCQRGWVSDDLILQGRRLGTAELAQVQSLVADYPGQTRYWLSRQLCQLWDWRTPGGQLKDMAARTLLLKLEQRQLVRLPARRCASPNRMRHKRPPAPADPLQPVTEALAALRPLEIVELGQAPGDLSRFESWLHHHHYLGYLSSVGMNLKYLVRDRHGRPLACALFGSAAWQCAVRDQWIGWDRAARQEHLQRITNNTRFLVIPGIVVPQLASHVLSLILRRLRADWFLKYRAPLSLVETFVDTSRFRGACYRAANWIDVGRTTGRTRQDRYNRLQVPPKQVLLYPLVSTFRAELGG